MGWRAPIARLLILSALTLSLAGGASAATPEEHLRVGLGAFEDGILGLASKELWAFTEKAPGDPRLEEVHYLIAEIELSRKKHKSAARALAHIVKARGSRAAASAYRLAELLEYLKDPKGALANYRLYLELGGKFNKATAHWKLALIERDIRNHGPAAEEFESFLQAAKADDQRRAAAREELVTELVSAGKAKQALGTALDALGAPELNKDNKARARVAAKGVALAVELKDHFAEARFYGALEKVSANRAEARGYLARRVFALERAGMEQEAVTAAGGYLKGGAGESPAQFAEVALAAARLEERRNNFKGALAHYRAALEEGELKLAGKGQKVALNLFALAVKTGDEPLAAQTAANLLDSRTGLAPAQQGKLSLFLAHRAHRSADLGTALVRYLAVDSASPLRPTALKGAARLQLDYKRYEEALPLVKELASKAPDDGEGPILALAAMRGLFEQERWNTALEVESLAAKADPEQASYLAAVALLSSGRAANARGRLDVLAQSGKAYAGPAHVRLAALDEKSGRSGQALLHYEKALGAQLNDQLRSFVQERLTALRAAQPAQKPKEEPTIREVEKKVE